MASSAAGSGGDADPGEQAARAQAARAAHAEAEIVRASESPVGDPEAVLLEYGEHLTGEKWMELWTRIGVRKRATSLKEKYEVSVEARKQEALQRLADVEAKRNLVLQALCGNPADR